MAEKNEKFGDDFGSVDLGWLIEALASAGHASADWAENEEALFEQMAGGRSQAGDTPMVYEKPYYGRPKERIPLFLTKLGELWQEYWPDWRFGQLVCNLDRYYRATHNDMDFFYLEEDAFEAFLEEYAELTRR